MKISLTNLFSGMSIIHFSAASLENDHRGLLILLGYGLFRARAACQQQERRQEPGKNGLLDSSHDLLPFFPGSRRQVGVSYQKTLTPPRSC